MDEFLEPYDTVFQRVSDVNQKPSPIYYNEQVDQIILMPETRSNLISRKVPRIIKVPIYELDENSVRIPVLEDDGAVKINDKGEIQYVIKGYKEKEAGYQTELDVVPASEIFTTDNATSNISQPAVNFLTRTYWFFDLLSFYQSKTKVDYSVYLHKLRNDAVTVLQASKSYNGGTVQAIKTFINKTDAKQWLQKDEEEEQSKGPLAWITGGNKKKKPNDSQKFTSYA